MTGKLDRNAKAEWQRHWPIVLAAMCGVALSTFNSFSVGLFIEPLEKAFGWSRAQISLGPAISAPVCVLLAPFIGAAIDRYGSRRIGLIGAIGLLSLNMLVALLVNSSIWSWWAMWSLIAVINLFIQPSVWTSAVSGFFTAGRGLALAITLCGSGIGSLITPFLAYELIDRFGWRMGLVGLACFWAVLVLPMMLLRFTSVRDQERAGVRERPVETVLAAGSGRKQLLSRRFLQLAIGGWLIASVLMSLIPNLVPLLSSTGIDRGAAAGIAASMGFASIAGRLTIGYLLDRVSGPVLAACSVCLPIVTATLLLAMPGSVPAATAGVMILGFALGAELDLVAYLTSRYFGLRSFGLLFGTIGGLITLAGAIGPLTMNSVYDMTQSYRPVLWAYIPMCLTSALLFLTLGRYPDLTGEEAATPAEPDAAPQPA